MSLRKIAFGFLALCALLFTFPSFFSTASPVEINPALPYLPPEALHFQSPSGTWHFRPFLLRHRATPGTFGEYTTQDEAALPLSFFVRTLPLFDTGSAAPTILRFCGVQGEYAGDSPHFLGTDQYGRDIWSRLLDGGRTSIAIGLAAASSATLLALMVGLIAGLVGGWVDILLMRFTEIMISVPWFYLLLAVRAMLPLRTSPMVAVLITTSLLALMGWARPARILRGATLELRQQAYVTMASTYGASRWHLVRWHLLPGVLPQTFTQFSILLPQFIASEVALSYFGLGVDEPLVSWGVMLTAAQHLSAIVSFPWLLAPVWAMVPLFFALHGITGQSNRAKWLTMFSSARQKRSIPLERA